MGAAAPPAPPQDTTPPTVAFKSGQVSYGGPSMALPAFTAQLPAASSPDPVAVLDWSAEDSSPVTFSCKLTGAGTSPLQKAVYYKMVNSAPVGAGAGGRSGRQAGR